MSLATRRVEGTYLGRVAALVAACTLVLTATFLGIVALASGAAAEVVSHLPWYVLVMASAFVATLVLVEESRAAGPRSLVAAAVVGLAAFVVVGLSVEGLLYALADPAAALGSHLLFYLLAAALIGSGLGYWGVQNWRDLARPVRRSGRRGGL